MSYEHYVAWCWIIVWNTHAAHTLGAQGVFVEWMNKRMDQPLQFKLAWRTRKHVVYNTQYLFISFPTASPLPPGYRLGIRSYTSFLRVYPWIFKELRYVYPFITNINTIEWALVEKGPRNGVHFSVMSGAKEPLCEIKTELRVCLPLHRSPRNQTGIVMRDDIVLNTLHCRVRSSISCWKGKRWNLLHLLWDRSDKQSPQGSVAAESLRWSGPLRSPTPSLPWMLCLLHAWL